MCSVFDTELGSNRVRDVSRNSLLVGYWVIDAHAHEAHHLKNTSSAN